MNYNGAGQLPRHLYVFVDSRYTHCNPCGFVPAVWFALISYPGRLWGCTIMLESGAIYRNLPPHALAFTKAPKKLWTPQQAQRWDCYGRHFTTIEYDYLAGLECRARAAKQTYAGEYLFSVMPLEDAFSAAPDQAKEFTFVKLNNGRLTIQPTNHTVFRERSFTNNPKLMMPDNLQRQTEVYTAE